MNGKTYGQGVGGADFAERCLRRGIRALSAAALASCCLLMATGCQPTPTKTQPVSGGNAGKNGATTTPASVTPQKIDALKPEVAEQAAPKPATPPSKSATTPPSTDLVAGAAVVQIPKVHLSETHANSLKVNVGDAFPAFSLPDAEGKPQSLDALKGRVTLVVFWRANEPTAVEELRDLAVQHLPAYGTAGLKVIAINSHDEPAAAKGALESFKPTFPCLTDAGGKVLNQVGAGQLPRTFLLDANGKVLWLDIEYSRTTRRQLLQALQAAFKEI